MRCNHCWEQHTISWTADKVSGRSKKAPQREQFLPHENIFPNPKKYEVILKPDAPYSKSAAKHFMFLVFQEIMV